MTDSFPVLIRIPQHPADVVLVVPVPGGLVDCEYLDGLGWGFLIKLYFDLDYFYFFHFRDMGITLGYYCLAVLAETGEEGSEPRHDMA